MVAAYNEFLVSARNLNILHIYAHAIIKPFYDFPVFERTY
jgi:hypothetical protein